jgi:hypothetical protein
MNWAVPEVRDYKLALVKELADKYALAGIELDFLRDDTLFRSDVDEDERVDIITDFIHKAREAMGKGQEAQRWLCVRIPLQLAAHKRIGLDVKRLWDAGVDMFNLSGWYHTTQRTDVADVRKLAPDAAIYLEMTHSTGWHPHFLKPGLYGTVGDPRTSDHQFYTTALLAHRRGADGLSLFNFVYYRMGYDADIPVMEPPFHVLNKLNDVIFLERQNRYYMLAGTVYYRQLPTVRSGETATLQMDMVPHAAAPREENAAPQARLRIHTKKTLLSNHGLTVEFNGKKLDACSDTSRFFGNPFDRMISPVGHRAAWALPTELIVDGLNEISVSGGREPVEMVYIDCGVRPAGT